MSIYKKIAQRQVASRRPAEDQMGFLRGYTKDKKVPANKRLWSPYSSSGLFSNLAFPKSRKR